LEAAFKEEKKSLMIKRGGINWKEKDKSEKKGPRRPKESLLLWTKGWQAAVKVDLGLTAPTGAEKDEEKKGGGYIPC